MTDTPAPNPDAQHLEVAPYDDDQRAKAPDWYDDTISVGEVANAEAGDQ